MRKLFILIMLASVLPILASAQAVMDHSQMDAQVSIDGSQHPEQIPDRVAYRLYFLAVSQTFEPKANMEHRFAHLHAAGMVGGDVVLASQILDGFRTQYLALVDAYNNDPGTQSGSYAALPLFKAKRDALVFNTRDAFVLGLSPLGRDSFLKRVQSEKRNMTVAAQEAQ